MIMNPLGYLFNPHRQWHEFATLPESKYFGPIIYAAVLATIPPVAFYYGIAVMGWNIGSDEKVTRLTTESALQITSMLYAAIILAWIAIGVTIHWMSKTYGTDTSNMKGIALAGLTGTPLFLSGLVGFYPDLLLNMLAGVIGLSWSIYLLYTAVPDAMGIPKERGFLYASAVIAVCLVIMVVILSGSVILWDLGFMPEFTD